MIKSPSRRLLLWKLIRQRTPTSSRAVKREVSARALITWANTGRKEEWQSKKTGHKKWSKQTVENPSDVNG